jgi:glycine cleavage system transcriptional repressor
MERRFIVSAFGKDRPGIVASITEMLYENGCNLEDTRMTILADEFAALLLVAGPERTDLEERISKACRRLEREQGISAYVRPVSSEAAERKAPFSTHTLKVEGLDQAGIVYKVSRYLAGKEINIANLDSSISSAPESGTTIYSMDMQIQVPEGASLDEFSDGLDQIAADLNVEITLEKS